MSPAHGIPEIVVVSASPDWHDRERIRDDLRSLAAGSIVIEGGQRGGERIAREEAQALGLHVATVLPLWDFHGKPAAYRRNEELPRLRPDLLLAYPRGGSPGTRHMVRIAEAECIQVREP